MSLPTDPRNLYPVSEWRDSDSELDYEAWLQQQLNQEDEEER